MKQDLSAKTLIRRFQLSPHVEGGAFRELYREDGRTEERPASGVIYYLLGAGERSQFHLLDADEYWLYHVGPPLRLWLLKPQGVVETRLLGLTEGAQPCVLMKAGTVFGARHEPNLPGDTLVSCVTVPEFSYQHYRILSRAEVLATWPRAEGFFTEQDPERI